MWFKSIVTLSCCLAGTNAAKVTLSGVQKGTNTASRNGYIVEVESSSNMPSKRSPHENLYTHLAARGVEFDLTKEFNTADIFVGASVSLTDASDVEKLRDAPGVRAVRPIVNIPRPQPKTSQVVKSPYDNGIPADTFSTHRMTGVDKLHAEGYFGKGITIGIIDTGIDYTHPYLGGAFGPGNLVIGGHDFVGDAYTGENEPVEDDDPLDQCAGHGTHVAGIIAALPNNEFNITGVAYGSSINAYRIFGCEGGVTDDILLDSLLNAYGDGNDIITLSLGGAEGWTASTSAVVASRIAARGTIVTAAAGNDGASGAWFTSAPGSGLNVISVGSVNNIVIPVQTATVSNAAVEHAPIAYYNVLPLHIEGDRPIYATSTDPDVDNDACDPLPDDTPDLSPYVVIVRRGNCSFPIKLDNIRAKGATAALIYNNIAGFSALSFGEQHADFPVSLILGEDGEYLVSEFASNSSLTLTFPQFGGSTTYPDDHGGLMSDFSTYGPSNDMFFKPAVSAPGGNILSTFPTTLGSFAVLSGTSMATPFVAGVAALLFEVKGKSAEVGLTARDLFESTAVPVLSDPSQETLQTITQQGSGLIQAYNALKTDIILGPTELLLNDTTHFQADHTITITNNGKRDMRFKVHHVPTKTAETIQANFILPNLGPVPLSDSPASVRLSTSFVNLGPGASQTIDVHITPPKNLDTSTFPVYGGYIEFSSRSETYRTSYVGVAASLKDKQIIDDSDYYFGLPIPMLLDADGNAENGTGRYTLQGEDYPTLLWRAAFGTPHFRVDLVDENVEFEATYPISGLSSRAAPSVEYVEEPTGSVKTVPIIGPLSELFWQSRNDEADTSFPYNTIGLEEGAFANGTVIPSGSYRMLLRALRVNGDNSNAKDYESFLSAPFIVDSTAASA